MSAAEGPETPAPRVRRERGARESLLAVALGLEAAVVFFATLVVFGLKALEPLPAFLGGGALLVLLVLLSGLQRHLVAVILGGVLQLVLIGSGILVPIMFLIGAGFAALWLWCLVRGGQLDRQRRDALAAAESS